MPFSYYQRLTRAQKAIYRASDRVARLPLHHAHELQPLVADLQTALEAGQAHGVSRAASALCRGICRSLGVRPARKEKEQAQLRLPFHTPRLRS